VNPDPGHVRRLVDAGFPEAAGQPVLPVLSNGTDNALFRVGSEWCLRLPRGDRASACVRTEAQWLPRLAAHLPLDVPRVVRLIEPDALWPTPWLVCRWIHGEDLERSPIVDVNRCAIDLAGFVLALRSIPATGAPLAGEGNFHRGVPLQWRDAATRDALAMLADELPIAPLEAIWERALQAGSWRGSPVWVHGDLHAGNLLGRDGRLAAVIDFGGLGAGDPAVDLMPAWTLFEGAARRRFLECLDADPDMVLRGRGWTLSTSAVALACYRPLGHPLAATARRILRHLLQAESKG
jgi:aminoglycoside phosphotransferase (APT) family kinase protein